MNLEDRYKNWSDQELLSRIADTLRYNRTQLTRKELVLLYDLIGVKDFSYWKSLNEIPNGAKDKAGAEVLLLVRIPKEDDKFLLSVERGMYSESQGFEVVGSEVMEYPADYFEGTYHILYWDYYPVVAGVIDLMIEGKKVESKSY